MPDLTLYLLEATICLSLCALYYRFCLESSRSIAFRRWYLLIAPLLALIFPAIDYNVIVDFFAVPNLLMQSPQEEFNPTLVGDLKDTAPDFTVKLSTIFMVVYFLTAAIRAMRLTDKLSHLSGLWRGNKPLKQLSWFDLPHPQFSTVACFSFLFWKKEALDEEEEIFFQQQKKHFRWYHSLDVVLMEGLAVVLWFHPVIYWFRQELKSLHITTAQHFMIPQGVEKILPNNAFSWVDKLKFQGVVPLVLGMLICIPLERSGHLFGASALQKFSENLTEFSELVLFKHEKPVPPVYYFQWGMTKIQLEKIAAPNGYSGKMEVELKDFQTMLDSSIRVFKNADTLANHTLDIVLESSETTRSSWFPNVDPHKIKLEKPQFGLVNDQVAEGDELAIMGMFDQIYLAGLTIKIKDPHELYEPKIEVPGINKNEPIFGFQIVNRKGKKTMVRLDTLNKELHHILDLYSDPYRYQIVHLPNFSTDRRLVTEHDALFPSSEIPVKNLMKKPYDLFQLPEYQDYRSQFVRLVLGKLIAAPSSQNYTLDEFSEHTRKDFQLIVGKEWLKILSFKLTIAPLDDTPTAYIADELDYQLLREEFHKMKPRTSVYLEQIIIEKDGKPVHFPVQFVFNIGDEKDEYKLAISESQEGTPKMSKREANYMYFQNYPLSELIANLTHNERMLFEGTSQEPHLDVLIAVQNLSSRKSQQLILKKLKQQYHYETEIRYEFRDVWVLKAPETLEKLAPHEYFYQVRPKLQTILKQHEQAGLETFTPGFMNDLANYIEDEFEVIVFNETEIEEAYTLGLKTRSLAAMREYLDNKYGLKLEQEKRSVKLVKVEF